MLDPLSISSSDVTVAKAPEYEELVHHSTRILEAYEALGRSHTNAFHSSFTLPSEDISSPAEPLHAADDFLSEPGFTKIYCGAAPLAPLRDRDWVVLDDWFEDAKMPDIQADIQASLLLRFPEPCWEDHVFDFLGEFL